ncbi:MAG: SIMPL domain-containing protein [Cytophagales bacterium]|nr:SIMPL domain-containing protein [Cytophagales bacterium]
MKKIAFSLILAFVSSWGFAQKTLVITGRGLEKIAPDQVNISLNLDQRNPDYLQCVKDLNNRIEQLTKAFEAKGFNPKTIKTSNYNIRQESRYNNKINRSEFVGYIASYRINIKFPFKQKLIDKAFSAIVSSLTQVSFNMGYTIAEPEKVKGRLIAKAVADARKKANILAKASGVELGEVVSIDYSEKTPGIYPEPYRVSFKDNARLQMDAMGAPEANPEDIQLTDQVTITWTIK